MELKKAIDERKSIRGYLNTPVEKSIIEEILSIATRAVSANNMQPWHFAVVTGSVLEEFKKENLRRLREGVKEDFSDADVEGEKYINRSRALGKALFAEMKIERHDKQARTDWMERGFMFFDAPCAILLYMEGDMDVTAFRFDMGCVAQNICLAAYEKGLGTCVANQAINFNSHYKKALGIPEDSRFVVGIAIGYPDPDFKANNVRSERANLSENTVWVGF